MYGENDAVIASHSEDPPPELTTLTLDAPDDGLVTGFGVCASETFVREIRIY